MAIVFKLRRGFRKVDENGNNLIEGGERVKGDWERYTDREGSAAYPLEGELVVEFDELPTGKKIPRLKIGDGAHSFQDLDYIGIESFILPTGAPKYTSVTLTADAWAAAGELNGLPVFSQVINLNGVTTYSKVDLQLSITDIAHFSDINVTFTTLNINGEVTVYAIGQKPTQDHTFYATITEVSSDGNS